MSTNKVLLEHGHIYPVVYTPSIATVLLQEQNSVTQKPENIYYLAFYRKSLPILVITVKPQCPTCMSHFAIK